ncbi:Uncharacterised protein [Chlamydia abortus]|nr:Uncharacterised protein [Chlamydia abortus]SGA33022.1 Uncharacterised protein [Chlamydia abortus]
MIILIMRNMISEKPSINLATGRPCSPERRIAIPKKIAKTMICKIFPSTKDLTGFEGKI